MPRVDRMSDHFFAVRWRDIGVWAVSSCADCDARQRCRMTLAGAGVVGMNRAQIFRWVGCGEYITCATGGHFGTSVCSTKASMTLKGSHGSPPSLRQMG